MLITSTWTQVTTNVGEGAEIQVLTPGPILIVYSAVAPTDQDAFILHDVRGIEKVTQAAPHEFVWAKAQNVDTEIVIRPISRRADDLYTYSVVMGAFDIAALPHNDLRYTFAISDVGDKPTTDIRLWVGSPPPADLSLWFLLTEQRVFSAGVAGPVYLAELDGKATKLVVVSSIPDEDIPLVKIETICNVVDLTANDDDLLNLVDTAGFNLVFCV